MEGCCEQGSEQNERKILTETVSASREDSAVWSY